MLQDYKTDVAVMILFFNRPEPLARVFAEVRRARPSQLFLYQDGPRSEADMPGIEACRKVVADIDWQCAVHRNYQTENAGCDPSNFRAQRWALATVDRCIFLEDDSIPAQSFFPFCKELLDRYADDPRIMMISGHNTEETWTRSPYDYLFTDTMNIWGWASWRRVISLWDTAYSFLDDADTMRLLRQETRRRGLRPEMIDAAKDHRASGREYYETLLWTAMLLNNGLAIVPTRNLITNLGAAAGSVHYSAQLATQPRRLRRLFTMGRHELDFPLRHPKHIIDDADYHDAFFRTHAWGHPWIKIGRSMEELALNLRHGQLRPIAKAVRLRIKKWMGLNRYK